MRWYVARRLLWTIFAAWLVLSGSFFLFAYTPDPNEELVAFSAGLGAATSGGNATEAAQEARAAYRSARNYDEPVHERYLRWVIGYATLDWGTATGGPTVDESVEGKAVTAIIVDRGGVTLAYLLPAMLVSLVAGVGVGLYSALREHTILDYLGTSFSYVGQGVPNFWLAQALVLVAVNDFAVYSAERWNPGGPFAEGNSVLVAISAFVVALNLLAVQVRYARSESKAYVSADFVKTVRSTGVSGVVVARHVLRNAAVPLTSLLFTEVLVVVLINAYVVETVLGIPGLGLTAYDAIQNRNIALILGTTMLVVFIALLGNLLQDLAYAVLDPRIDYEQE